MLLVQIDDNQHWPEYGLHQALFALDFPQTGASEEGSLIKFRGWVVIPDRADMPQIVFEQGSSRMVAPLNVDRPDVARKLREGKNINAPLQSGFTYELPLECGEVIVSFQLGDTQFKWKTITVSQLDEDARLADLANICDNLGAYDPKLLESNNIDFTKAVPQGFLNHLSESKFRGIRSIRSESAGDAPGLSQSEVYYFKKMTSELTDDDVFFNFLDSARRTNSLVLRNPFAPGFAICNQSFIVNGLNILVFQADAEYFFIAQHLHSADMVFFPKRNLVLLLAGGHHDLSVFRALILTLIRQPEILRQINEKNARSQFLGIVVNDLTPYHFFYDILPALEELKQKSLLDYAGPIYALNGKEYLSIASLYGLSSAESSARPADLAAMQNKNGGFFLYVGASSTSKFDATIPKLDERLIEFSSSPSWSNVDTRADEELMGRGPVIWIGISSFKRSWINQVEALRNTLCTLLGKYPSLFVIFDGMTSSVFSSVNKDDLTLADEAIVSEIVGSILEPNQYLSMVGRTSLEKIQYAKIADLFIANYSTGSMYPARIHKKPGVAHLSKAMLPAVESMHVHFNTRLISGTEIEDIPDPSSPRIDFVSYKVDEAAIIREVFSLLTELHLDPR